MTITRADTRILKQLTDDVLMLEEEGGEELARFAQWVTASVAAQSQALDAGRAAPGISLAKAGDAGITLVKPGDESTPQDDQVVVLTGRCSRNRKPYLLKYQALAMPDVLGNFGGTSPTGIYGLEGCYGLEEDYFDWTAQRTAPATPVSTDQLEGVAPCPHCGAATTFALGGCDHLMCCDGPGEQTCPWCDAAVNFGPGSNDAFDVGRGLG